MKQDLQATGESRGENAELRAVGSTFSRTAARVRAAAVPPARLRLAGGEAVPCPALQGTSTDGSFLSWCFGWSSLEGKGGLFETVHANIPTETGFFCVGWRLFSCGRAREAWSGLAGHPRTWLSPPGGSQGRASRALGRVQTPWVSSRTQAALPGAAGRGFQRPCPPRGRCPATPAPRLPPQRGLSQQGGSCSRSDFLRFHFLFE